MKPGFFRDLDPGEEKEFREAARKNYEIGQMIEEVWHPVYQEECAKMNVEEWRATMYRKQSAENAS